MKQSNIMTFKRFLNYFNIKESFKEKRLNSILQKINKGEDITNVEKSFLDRYGDIDETEMRDHMMLSMSSAYKIISDMLERERKVICNLTDRNGVINSPIISITNDYENECCILKLRSGEICKMKDNFLYNIIYDVELDQFSLEAHDEYFEKIPVKK